MGRLDCTVVCLTRCGDGGSENGVKMSLPHLEARLLTPQIAARGQ